MAPDRGDSPTDHQATLDRLKALHPRVIDLSLDRIIRLLEALGRPQDRLPPVVHVGGTNGKGSVVAFLRAGLEAAGHRVHVFTSPHLVRFNERIRLAGRLIADADLAALLDEVEAANAGRPITVFELTTAAALLAFSRTPADVLLLEVGLGGRLDATNVVADPAVAVLTPIDIDHQAYLGDDLATIAGEKAGILKPGVPAVVAPQPIEAEQVIRQRARAIEAPLRWGGMDWAGHETGTGWKTTDGRVWPAPRLIGGYQVANAAQAFAVLDALAERTGLVVGDEARQRAMATVDWPARLQRLEMGHFVDRLPGNIELWVDGGHNPHASRAVAAALASRQEGMFLDLVCAMSAQKDPAGFLAAFAPLVRSVTAIPLLVPFQDGAQAGLPAHILANAARDSGLRNVHKAKSLAAAIEDLAGGEGPARILVCGSLYLAGALLAENGTPPT